jgi:hypothetical protein
MEIGRRKLGGTIKNTKEFAWDLIFSRSTA